MARRLRTKIKPQFADGEDKSELSQGHRGSGSLVRKYIDDLDMEFYVSRSKEKREGQTGIVSLRIADDILKDLSIVVESGKTRFRDRSEFIRTAILILLNYYAHHPAITMGIKEKVILRDIEDRQAYEREIREKAEKVCKEFNELIPIIEKDGDYELDKFINQQIELAESHKNPNIRRKLISSMYKTLRANNIDPLLYFDRVEDEKG